jgi:hypothetical protein
VTSKEKDDHDTKLELDFAELNDYAENKEPKKKNQRKKKLMPEVDPRILNCLKNNLSESYSMVFILKI